MRTHTTDGALPNRLVISVLICIAAPTIVMAVDASGTPISPPSAGERSIRERSTLTGDWNGQRTWLEGQGVTFSLTQTSDFLGNPSGGIRPAGAYDGVLEPEVDIDLGKLLHWSGGSVHVAGYAIQGHGLSQYDLGNLFVVTSVEAQAGFKLGELWFQQNVFEDALAIRVGRILADQSFVTSDTAALFVNSTFGFPGSFGTDLPGGGPAYPNATAGAQVILKPNSSWTVQAALFNGAPNRRVFSSGFFAIAEIAYNFSPPKGANGLPGTYKVGAWYNSETFDDLAVATNGVSLASPLSSGAPQRRKGNYALYGVIDQLLWSEPGTDSQGLSGFIRATVNPQSDRNEIAWYFDLGLGYTGLLPGGEDDVFGIGFAYGRIGSDLADLARATNAYSGAFSPTPDYEAVFEATYQANVAPWLSVQPFFQYIFHPGGNALDPDNPNVAIKNATVVGLRIAVTL